MKKPSATWKLWAPTFLKVLAVIFVAEAAVMAFLHLLGPRPTLGIILNPVLLGLITAPLLYRCAVKPLAQGFQRRRRIDDMLQFTIEGTSNALEDDFFRSLTQHLATALDVRYAIVGELVKPQCKSIRTLAVWANGRSAENMEYDLAGTPCQNVMDRATCLYARGVQALFPEDKNLVDLGAESYLGVSLVDSSGHTLGIIIVLDDKPFPDDFASLAQSLLELFASRAAAELERTRNERALRESEQNYRALVENANSIILRIDRQGNLTFLNNFAESYFGYAKEEILGKNVVGTIVPEKESSGRDLAKHLHDICENPEAFRSNENENMRRDGSRVWFAWTNRPLRDKNGRINELLCIGNDVTLRKEAELKLAESEHKFRTIFEASSDSVLFIRFVEGQSTIADCNTGALTMFGYAREEILGKSFLELSPLRQFDGALTAERYAEIGRSALDRRTLLFEWTHQRGDGANFEGEVTINHVEIQGEAFLLATIRDITERKLARAEREKASAAAEAANRTKTEFLANMSHEIRTPLTAILGFTDILHDNLEQPDSQSQQDNLDAVDTIQRNGNHLLELINDILDLSKIEADKLVPERISCQPHQAITEIVSLLEPMAKSKGLSLGFVCEGPMPEQIQTDPTRLRQLLLNLLSNAIKFTDSGQVRMTVELLDGQSSEPTLRIRIIDTGIGISPQQLQSIFQPFAQADASTARRFGGAGLGLVICKRLAELLGGDITVESEFGKGSAFTLTIATGPLDGVPMLQSPAGSSLAETGANVDSRPLSLSGRRLLLAEDGPDNQRLISLLLKKAGAQVVLVENGQLALESIQATEADGLPFDLILMDMAMPVLDGYQATKQLRAEGYIGPIVALTAHAMSTDRDKCLAAGCDDYLAKPIDRAKLLETISRHVLAAEAAN